METTKIIERIDYRKSIEYEYRKCLPRDVWYTDYEGDSKNIYVLRKPIKIEEIGAPSWDSVEWYDNFGNKDSNVDYQYDVHDYRFYHVVYETIYLDDEAGLGGDESDYNYNDFEGTIEYREEEEYIYIDEHKNLSSYELESDINELARDVKECLGLDDEENCYGDCYSDKVHDCESEILALSTDNKLTCADYRDYLGYIREKLDNQVRAYLDTKDDVCEK